jgi:hypothetical protein
MTDQQRTKGTHGVRYTPKDGGGILRIGFFDNTYQQQYAGIIKYSNGNVYEGRIQDDLYHGAGFFRSNVDDEIRFCECDTWRFGVMRGHVKIIYANKDIYIGEYANGKPHGRGTMTFCLPTKKTYTGQWVHGIATGTAVITYHSEQLIYVGDCVNGLPHGHGTMTRFPCTVIAKGQWKDGKAVVVVEDTLQQQRQLPPPPGLEKINDDDDNVIISHTEVKMKKKKSTLGAFLTPPVPSKKIVLLKKSSSFLNLQSFSQETILTAIYTIKTLKPDGDILDHTMI